MLRAVLGKIHSGPSCKIINPANISDKKTIIVIGCARGGTSMVAGLIRKLGIFMGENIDGPNHEDQDFMTDDLEALQEAVATRNSHHLYWGWKNTDEGIARIRLIFPYLRNPHIIVVFRNFLDVVESFNKYENIALAPGMQDIGERYANITQLMGTLECPILAVNYDNAINSKMSTASNIASFLGIKCSRASLRESANFINKKAGYSFIIEPITLLERSYVVSLPDNAVSQPVSVTIQNAEPHESGYLGIENDPQFIITHQDKTAFGTQIIVCFRASIPEKDAVTILYYTACTEFTEQHSERIVIVEGLNIIALHFSAPLKTLRIDPMGSNGYFELSDIALYSTAYVL